MAAAIGVNYLLTDNPAILHIVHLELRTMPKMLENLSVIVGYCYSHCLFPFLLAKQAFTARIKFPATLMTTAGSKGRAITQAVIPPGNEKAFAIDNHISKLGACQLINLRHGSTGNIHLHRALGMCQLFQVDQAYCLILIQSQHDFAIGSIPCRAKAAIYRLRAHTPASSRSCHFIPPLLVSVICR